MGITSHYRHIMFESILICAILIQSVYSVQAQPYYADISITVDSSGFVSIQGLTNYPNLSTFETQEYTSKQQSYWLLNITKKELFSEYVFDLKLPQDSSINYIKSSGSIRIEENQGNLQVKGFGENESLSIIIQYQIKKQNESFIQGHFLYLFLIPLIIFISLIIVFLLYKEKKNKTTPQNTDFHYANITGLNHRQKQIVYLLHEKKIPLTQTDIQKELQIPKASVSRNLLGLERKGLIEKEHIGISNLIRLKKQ
jgi:uncharacterized membrane protein